MYSEQLKIGMTLYCDDGYSTVELCSVQNDTIIVQYKGKRYPRPISIIGKRLFITPVSTKKSPSAAQERDYTKISTVKVEPSGLSVSYKHSVQQANSTHYDSNGYDCDGYDQYGYNANGYNRLGYDRNGCDKFGYDAYGYDKKGFNKKGYNRNGFDRSGYNALGFDKNGYDKNGYDRNGYDKEGYDKYGYNKFDLNKSLEFRPGSLVADSLIPHITKLYHIVFGEGVLLSLDVKEKGIHLCVEFTSGSKTFVYPNCFSEGHLMFDKSDEMRDFEEFLNTPNGRKIFEEENSFLSTLSASIRTDVDLAERNHTDAIYSLQSVQDDSWSPELSSELKQAFSDTYREQLKMYSIKREPYFARVDAGDDSFYIGKNGYKNIIEWTDPLASLYYEYQMYIGNDERRLSLVRDLRVYLENICSIRDKYNVQMRLDESLSDSKNEVISDPNLLMIINANRDNKAVHDIIATIQNNQYKIITKSLEENLVVSGCAGSGKTMIMLHRLRYLLRNNQALSSKNIIVLSPTDALTNENSQLAMLLGMGDINVFSNIRLYAFILESICRENGWSFINKKTSYQSNDYVNKEQIKTIYCEQALNSIYENVLKVIHDSEKKNMYLSMSFEEIRRRKIDFLGLSYIEDKEERLFKKLEQAHSCFVKFKQTVKSLSIKNIEAFKIHNRANKNLTDSRREARNKALNLLLEHTELLSHITLYKTKKLKDVDEIQDDSDILKSLYDFLESVYWDTDEAYCGEEDPIDMFDEYYYPISQYEKRVTSFSDGDNYACLLDIIDFVVTAHKTEMGIAIHQHFEWELFVQVYVLSLCSKFAFEKSELLLVDEYQDYSICELKVLDKLFPNAVFNYFGDAEQAISGKNSSKQTIFEYFNNKSAATHSINENYRNAKEITEYVNSEMNMNMRPVGISGQVAIIGLDAISKIAIDVDDRVALICKKERIEELYSHIAHKLNVKCNLISDQSDEFQRGLINIIPVSLTKGLEFEKVVAVIDGMTFNERYVSFTRALNDLYVID